MPDMTSILSTHGQLLLDLSPILGVSIIFGFILHFLGR